MESSSRWPGTEKEGIGLGIKGIETMRTVTICGSMRFEKEMQRIAFDLETKHHMNVLQCVYNIDNKEISDFERTALAEAHYRKIEISDAIYIVDIQGYIVDIQGYIGDSVSGEIQFARTRGKEIIWHSSYGLSEMSLEELWELFPVFLVEHDEKWELFYADIESRLHQILADCRVERISHIGSTAIPGIWAKDIVDILIEISEAADIEDAAWIIENNGFIRMSTGKRRISFNLGYTKDGFADRVFHVHLRYAGDNDELYFRDYLVEHPQTAKEYERLKLNLCKQFEHNRDAYTDAKTEFIRKWTDVAKSVYPGRY